MCSCHCTKCRRSEDREVDNILRTMNLPKDVERAVLQMALHRKGSYPERLWGGYFELRRHFADLLFCRKEGF